jgi:hypothetical protein
MSDAHRPDLDGSATSTPHPPLDQHFAEARATAARETRAQRIGCALALLMLMALAWRCR